MWYEEGRITVTIDKINILRHQPPHNVAILDNVIIQNLLVQHTAYVGMQHFTNYLTAHLLYNSTIWITHTAHLYVPKLSKAAAKAHIFPYLQSVTLLYLVQLYGFVCEVLMWKHSIAIL